jgi:hypothetical protein
MLKDDNLCIVCGFVAGEATPTPKPIESLDELDKILNEMCQYVHSCAVAGGVYGIFIGGEPMQEAKQALNAYITERERLARIDELKEVSVVLGVVDEVARRHVRDRLTSLSTQEEVI